MQPVPFLYYHKKYSFGYAFTAQDTQEAVVGSVKYLPCRSITDKYDVVKSQAVELICVHTWPSAG